MVAKTCFFLLKMMKCGENTIKNKLGIKFHSEPVYEYKYLKAKLRDFDGAIKTNFLGNVCQKKICIILALLA